MAARKVPPPIPPPNRPSQPAPAGLLLDPDEPAFVLRASDLLAADFVRLWAARAEEFGVPTPRIQQALRTADAMDRWRLTRGRR